MCIWTDFIDFVHNICKKVLTRLHGRVILSRGKPFTGKAAPYTPKILAFVPSGMNMLDCVQPAFEVSTLHFNRT